MNKDNATYFLSNLASSIYYNQIISSIDNTINMFLKSIFGFDGTKLIIDSSSLMGKAIGYAYTFLATFVVIEVVYSIVKFMIKNDKPPFRDIAWDIVIKTIICYILLHGSDIVEGISSAFLGLRNEIMNYKSLLTPYLQLISSTGNFIRAVVETGTGKLVGVEITNPLYVIPILIAAIGCLIFTIYSIVIVLLNTCSCIVLLYCLPVIVFLSLFKIFRSSITQYIELLLSNILIFLMVALISSKVCKFIITTIEHIDFKSAITNSKDGGVTIADVCMTSICLCLMFLLGTFFIQVAKAIAEKLTKASIESAAAGAAQAVSSSAGRAMGLSVGAPAKLATGSAKALDATKKGIGRLMNKSKNKTDSVSNKTDSVSNKTDSVSKDAMDRHGGE